MCFVHNQYLTLFGYQLPAPLKWLYDIKHFHYVITSKKLYVSMIIKYVGFCTNMGVTNALI